MMKRCVECGSLIFRQRIEVKWEKDGRVLKTNYIHERCLDKFMAWVKPTYIAGYVETVKK